MLAADYDAAINRHDPAAAAALYTQDAVRTTAMNDGTFHGREAIEKSYAKYNFERWQVHNYFTKVYRLTAAGNEVRSAGTCSSNFLREGNISSSWIFRVVDARVHSVPHRELKVVLVRY